MSNFNRQVAETIEDMIDSELVDMSIEDIAERHFQGISVNPALVGIIEQSLSRAKGFLDRKGMLVAFYHRLTDGTKCRVQGRHRAKHGITTDPEIVEADLATRMNKANGAKMAVVEKVYRAHESGALNDTASTRILNGEQRKALPAKTGTDPAF